MNDTFLVQVCQSTEDTTCDLPEDSFVRTSASSDYHLAYRFKTSSFAVFHCYCCSLSLHYESAVEFDDKR